MQVNPTPKLSTSVSLPGQNQGQPQSIKKVQLIRPSGIQHYVPASQLNTKTNPSIFQQSFQSSKLSPQNSKTIRNLNREIFKNFK